MLDFRKKHPFLGCHCEAFFAEAISSRAKKGDCFGKERLAMTPEKGKLLPQ
jgi:hypothetical protein